VADSLDEYQGKLYVVATPVGNLDDITLRAVEILKKVDIIAAEDTRNTSVLSDKYDISTKLISYHKFSQNSKINLLLEYLKEGKSIALVSDAGTPLISDPGNILVQKAREGNFKVIPIPGACAAIALLSATYRCDEDFKFIGFIDRNESKITETIRKNNEENLIFYESPNRLLPTLEIIAKIYNDKKITIGRELTKKFEEIKTGNITDIIKYYKNNTLKGEIVVLLHKSTGKRKEEDIKNKIAKLKKLDLKDKEISSILASLYDLNKNEIYKICINDFKTD